MSAAILVLSLALGAEPRAYPKSNLLIEPAALAARLGKITVLDTRPAKAYDEGHIPGAIRIDPAEWSKRFNAGPDAEQWSRIFRELGLDPDHAIAVYGDSWTDTARVWWILRYCGVEHARLMNGTFASWKEAGGKVSTEAAQPTPSRGDVRPTRRLATKKDVLDILKDGSSQILDVRSEGEFCGTAGAAKKKGAIPGAVNLEWKAFIDAKTQKLKPAAEIAALLDKAGIDPRKPVVTYCQSGGRAAVGAFVLELMGGEQVRNYYRSWSEWGNADDTPVAKPEAKK